MIDMVLEVVRTLFAVVRALRGGCFPTFDRPASGVDRMLESEDSARDRLGWRIV